MSLIPILLILLVIGIKNDDEDIYWDEVLQTYSVGITVYSEGALTTFFISGRW